MKVKVGGKLFPFVREVDFADMDGEVTDEGELEVTGGGGGGGGVQPGDDVDTLGSGAATDGQVATADGAGNVAWETPDPTLLVDGLTLNDTGAATANATAIQNKIDAHGVAWLPLADETTPIYIDATISIPEGGGLFGASADRGTVLKVVDNANLDAVVASAAWLNDSATSSRAITVYNVMVDGNKANQSSGLGHGFVSLNYRSLFFGCHAYECGGDGFLHTDAGVSGTTISNTNVEPRFIQCKATRCDANGFHSESTSGASKTTDGWIDGCSVSTPGENFILLEHAGGWKVTNNQLFQVAGQGVGTNGIRAENCFGTQIIGNNIDTWGSVDDGGNYYGIDAIGIDGRDNVIANNVLDLKDEGLTNKPSHIRLHTSSNQEPRWVVNGNIMSEDAVGASTYGISFARAGSGTNHGLIANNVAGDNVSVPFTGIGSGASSNVKVHNNEWQFDTAAPSSGFHNVGEIVYKSDVAAGGSFGWVCVTAGSPGTWKALPNVAA